MPWPEPFDAIGNLDEILPLEPGVSIWPYVPEDRYSDIPMRDAGCLKWYEGLKTANVYLLDAGSNDPFPRIIDGLKYCSGDFFVTSGGIYSSDLPEICGKEISEIEKTDNFGGRIDGCYMKNPAIRGRKFVVIKRENERLVGLIPKEIGFYDYRSIDLLYAPLSLISSFSFERDAVVGLYFTDPEKLVRLPEINLEDASDVSMFWLYDENGASKSRDSTEELFRYRLFGMSKRLSNMVESSFVGAMDLHDFFFFTETADSVKIDRGIAMNAKIAKFYDNNSLRFLGEFLELARTQFRNTVLVNYKKHPVNRPVVFLSDKDLEVRETKIAKPLDLNSISLESKG